MIEQATGVLEFHVAKTAHKRSLVNGSDARQHVNPQ
jgi:hypothetical protein